MLACKRLHGSHTGEYIIQQIEEVMASFEIHHIVGHAITDNESNMKKAFSLFDVINEVTSDNSDED